jgi:cell division initiation protein
MNLSPSDVEQKAFTQALRGYQMDEVDDFLDEVVAALRSYEQKLKDSQEKIHALETDAANRGGDEGAISRAFVAAQRSADALVAEAEAEAEKIRQRAIAETDELSSQRESERTRILGDIGALKERVLALRGRLSELTGAIGQHLGDVESELGEAENELTSRSETAGQDEAAEPAPAVDLDEVDPVHALVDLDEEAEQAIAEESVSRVSSRPWERG